MIYCVGLNPAIDKVLLVDNFTIGSHRRVKVVGRYAAGKASNVARILSILGVKSSLMGFVGQKDYRFFVESFKGSLVTPLFSQVDFPVRVNTTVIDSILNTETHLREEGEVVTSSDYLRFEKYLLSKINKGDTVVFSGSIPVGIEPDLLCATLQKIIDMGIRVGGDFNGKILEIINNLPLDFIKPNRDEFSKLIGVNINSHDELVEHALRFLNSETKIKKIILSDGRYGAGIFTADEVFWAKAKSSIEVKSTVGAGDALLAGFLGGLERSELLEIKGMIKTAVSTALSSICSLEVGVVKLAEIAFFRQNLSISRLK